MYPPIRVGTNCDLAIELILDARWKIAHAHGAQRIHFLTADKPVRQRRHDGIALVARQDRNQDRLAAWVDAAPCSLGQCLCGARRLDNRSASETIGVGE